MHPLALGELLIEEGLMLLVGYLDKLGVPRSEREQRGWTADVLRPIVQGALGHPLALELLTPHVKELGPERVIEDLGGLLASSEQSHHEGRNRSIGYSLEFSIRHLSDTSRAVLPAIALLSGGCLDEMAQDVTGLDDTAWQRVRAEYERLGLIRMKDPWLRPHPVLDRYVHEPTALAAGLHAKSNEEPDRSTNANSEASAFGSHDDLHERFQTATLKLCRTFDQAVRTPQSKLALAMLGGSEVVVRRAIELATSRGRLEFSYMMVDSLKGFLELTGRSGEGAELMANLARHSTHDTAFRGGDILPPYSRRQDAADTRNTCDPETLTEIESKLLRQAATTRAPDAGRRCRRGPHRSARPPRPCAGLGHAVRTSHCQLDARTNSVRLRKPSARCNHAAAGRCRSIRGTGDLRVSGWEQHKPRRRAG